MRAFNLVVLLVAAAALTGCGEYRYVGTKSCSADGSVVWFEQANSQGSFEGLGNTPENCETKGRPY